MKADILQVAETSLCNLRDAGIPVCDADVCCGTTGQTVQQAWYTACHPIPRRHQTLIRSTLNTQKKQFSGFIRRTIQPSGYFTLQILAYADNVNLIGRSTGRLKDAVVQPHFVGSLLWKREPTKWG